MKIRENLERIRGKFLARENARNAENIGVFAEKRTKKWYNKDTGEDTIREDDEIWRTTEEGNKIQFNEKGEVTGGNAYAVQKMKQGGAKVSPSAKTKELTPKKTKKTESETVTSSESSSSATGSSAGGSGKMSESLQKTLQAQPPEVREKHEVARKVSEEYYKKGRELAESYQQLRSFTDHNSLHIDQVCEKTLKAAEVLEDCLRNDPNYGPIDEGEALAAARLHDTGMDGDTSRNYQDIDGKGTVDDGTKLRKDHASNSAMHILENRDALEAAGVDPDRVAFYAFAHSKSSSGLSDLNSEECWNKAFDNIEKFVEMHNNNPNCTQKVSFDRSKFDDPEVRASARSTIAALRFGDANRDAPEGDQNLTQGGGVIEVDSSGYDRNHEYGDWEEERKAFKATATYPDGRVAHTGTDDFDKTKYSTGIYVGEGNLSTINCVKGKNNEITEEFAVKDATMAPHCTFNAINERLGEMSTATGIPRAATIKLPPGTSEADAKRIISVYKSDLDKEREKAIRKTGKDPYKDIRVTVVDGNGGEVEI